jgi:hypothetical protein
MATTSASSRFRAPIFIAYLLQSPNDRVNGPR